jgi:hypothetical protein
MLYAMRVSKKKSASDFTNEFIATCSVRSPPITPSNHHKSYTAKLA